MQSNIKGLRRSYFIPLIAVSLLALAMPHATLGQEFVVYSASGVDAASITAVVDAFRNALGANNGNAAGPLAGGRREINWDGGGSSATTLSPTPFAGFQANRGALFTTAGTGFVQAPVSGLATNFSNATYSTIFTTFSPLRLFTAEGSNITDAQFFIPGTDIAAKVNAFGAVFTDVDLPESTFIEYFDANDKSLGKVFVPPSNNGLSFVGVVFTSQRVALVRITSGNTAPGPTAFDAGDIDVVVMDDFIYSEPSVVGPPTEKKQCKKGGWETFEFPRLFKNQGDCIKFVNTGK
jgi:hypothetical protein